jgi:hypothetical protein
VVTTNSRTLTIPTAIAGLLMCVSQTIVVALLDGRMTATSHRKREREKWRMIRSEVERTIASMANKSFDKQKANVMNEPQKSELGVDDQKGDHRLLLVMSRVEGRS